MQWSYSIPWTTGYCSWNMAGAHALDKHLGHQQLVPRSRKAIHSSHFILCLPCVKTTQIRPFGIGSDLVYQFIVMGLVFDLYCDWSMKPFCLGGTQAKCLLRAMVRLVSSLVWLLRHVRDHVSATLLRWSNCSWECGCLPQDLTVSWQLGQWYVWQVRHFAQRSVLQSNHYDFRDVERRRGC